MLNQIKTLLKSFENKGVRYQIDEKKWLEIVVLYRKCAAEQQEILVERLSQRFTLAAMEIQRILSSLTTIELTPDSVRQGLEAFRTAQTLAEDKIIDLFKQRALNHIPDLNLNISRDVWLELSRRCEKLHVKSLSRAFLVSELSRISKVERAQLTLMFSKKLPPREAKAKRPVPSEAKLPSCKRRHPGHEGENQLIFQATDENKHLHSPLKATGARIAELTEQASPEKGYQDLKRTPGGRKVRHYYTNSQGSFFKPVTPHGNKSQSGMVDVSNGKRREIIKRIPKLDFSRPEKINFTATLEKLEERAVHNRKLSPKKYTGARCHDVFKAHGDEENISIFGRDYHWSHLIAKFLGGDETVIPGTAVSNYNTLELVEHFIAKKLIKDKVEAIEIEVECRYNGDIFVPDELIFSLNWGFGNFEKISINPRSYARITKPMHRSIELLRSYQDEEHYPLSEDEDLDFGGNNKDVFEFIAIEDNIDVFSSHPSYSRYRSF